MTAILGLSAFYHDSAAAIVVDGKLVAAAQEERFSRIKHDASFPEQAIQYCLTEAGLGPQQLDHVGFYEKPFTRLERVLETYLQHSPTGYRSFLRAMPLWMKQKLWQGRTLRRSLGFDGRLAYAEHHVAHAASAFFPSPFDSAAILTIDGVGEWCTTTIGYGQQQRLKLLREINFPDSLGLLYGTFTAYCGFRVNGGEGKLMGLAPYGQPVYADLICEKLLHSFADGSFRLNPDYFRFGVSDQMHAPRLERLLGFPPRPPESALDQVYCDLAASVQKVTEQHVVELARVTQDLTGSRRLCLAGGVALNCVANGKLIDAGLFDEIWIQPAAGDAGGALGTALWIWHQLLGNARHPQIPDGMQGALLGPTVSAERLVPKLDQHQIAYQRFNSPDQLDKMVGEILANQQVVGWCQGRMEFGPRALGSRSILADPRPPDMQGRLNQKIKRRESFRPFAPAVLSDRASQAFQMKESSSAHAARYMLATTNVQAPSEKNVTKSIPLYTPTSSQRFPAITHVDGSARFQIVDSDVHGRFARLLEAFEQQTGCPMLVNTSLNVRGEPIAGSEWDAVRCFATTDLDALVVEDLLLKKSDQRDSNLANLLADPEIPGFAPSPSRSPSVTTLAGFVAGQVIGASVLLTILGLRYSLPFSYLAVGILLFAAVGIGLFRKKSWLIPLYHVYQLVILRLNRLLTATLLTGLFIVMVVPLGWVLRWRSGLAPPRESTWRERQQPDTVRDVFRQYIKTS